MLADGRAPGEQAIEGHEGGDRRKQRQQAVEDDAGRDRKQAVLVELLPSAPQDVLPTAERDVPRRGRLAAAVGLIGPRLLPRERLVGRAPGAERAGGRVARALQLKRERAGAEQQDEADEERRRIAPPAGVPAGHRVFSTANNRKAGSKLQAKRRTAFPPPGFWSKERPRAG